MSLLSQIMLRPIVQIDPLVSSINAVTRELDFVHRWFETETDPDLLDACIYRRLSLEAEHRYLLRTAKSESVRQDPMQDLFF